MIENRRSYRLPFRTKFVFSTDQEVLTGNSLNVSAGGIFILSLETEKVKRGMTCRCLFSLEPDDDPICIQAEVRRVISQSTNPEETPGIGLYFIHSDESEISRLLAFMERSRKNLEVAATILSGGEPDLQSLNPLLAQLHLPPFSDLGELRFYVERVLRAIEMVEHSAADLSSS